MKKDLNWLKEEIAKEMIELEPNRKERWSDVKYQTLRSVAQKIYQLDELEVLSREWIDGETFVVTDSDGDDYAVVAHSTLQNILVPKQEVPVIPKYVADWITKHREKYDLYPALRALEYNTSVWEQIYKWYRTNTHDFVNAYLTGEYEVGEEQKYLVSSRESEGFWFLSKNNDSEVVIGTNKAYYDRKWESLKLTEEEIKDYDSRYWAFAIPVEELEE